MSPRPVRLEFIDALRGLAFLGVLCAHISTKVHGIPVPVFRILNHLSCGVQLFFIISALTLFRSFDARTSGEARPLLNFWIRRIFRIAPAFYAAGLFYLVFFPGHRFDPRMPGPITLGSLVSTATFTNGFCPRWINQVVPGGWSIAIEMTFYAIVPFLYRWIRTLRVAIRVVLIAETCALLSTYLIGKYGLVGKYGLLNTYELEVINAFLGFYFPRHFPIFLMGIVLYFVLKRMEGGGRLGLGVSRRQADSISLLILLISLISYIIISLLHRSGINIFLFGISLTLAAWALAISPLKVAVNCLSCYLGRVSFGAYLMHFAVLEIVEQFSLDANLPAHGWFVHYSVMLVLSLAGTVVFATVIFRVIERPGQRLGKRLIAFSERRARFQLVPNADSLAVSAAADAVRRSPGELPSGGQHFPLHSQPVPE
jgi:peptidoglycan/LPS O-acetylase OafA/YrhL